MRYFPVVLAVLLSAATLPADDPVRPADLPKPLQLTAREDHKRMLEALRIKELRRGADGNNRNAPNAANTDESKATPYPNLPDPLVFDDGSLVKTPADWRKRRAEIRPT